MPEDFQAQQIIIIMGTIFVSYIIFGIVGFGTSLIASPILVTFMPLSKIIPILALLDMFAALNNIYHDGKNAQYSELKKLIPLMVIGSLIGVTVLFKTKPDILLLALGIFAIIYGLYTLSAKHNHYSFSPSMVIPFGLTGGLCSALFGSGGFIYAIYLSNRIKSKSTFRITQTTLLGFSTLTRVILFILLGVYSDKSLIIIIIFLIPIMLCGNFLGSHINLHLTKEQFTRIINIIILISGFSLIIKYFGMIDFI
ncbi:sulfite exporter TauE/SafE family protein [Stenoxybacter acetivorans]|uniref:sulfite exporter TauE/SafE family protein n=1 Tax=Stenoxybacter acetivorans TaxID=422441 RepID=UPI000566A50C|nr:sulfite exporter TauE/SafE family protein [Stenoxybacter acetivorans]